MQVVTGKLPELLGKEAEWEAQQPEGEGACADAGAGAALDQLELSRGFRRRTGVGPLLLDGIATRRIDRKSVV